MALERPGWSRADFRMRRQAACDLARVRGPEPRQKAILDALGIASSVGGTYQGPSLSEEPGFVARM